MATPAYLDKDAWRHPITRQFLERGLRRCSQLSELDLSGHDLSILAWVDVMKALADSGCRLRVVRLSDCRTDARTAAVLLQHLSGNKELVELDLAGSGQLSPEDLRVCLAGQPCLESLSLADYNEPSMVRRQGHAYSSTHGHVASMLLGTALSRLRRLNLRGFFNPKYGPPVSQVDTVVSHLQAVALHLEAINLSDTAVTDTTLRALAAKHPSLHALSVANTPHLTQHGIDGFAELRYLDVSHNKNISRLPPSCAATLHTLIAQGDSAISDASLEHATNIRTLNVSDNPRVTTVAPFGAALRELDASGEKCGVTDDGLNTANGIVKLNVSGNPRVTTVAPFGATLRELDACGNGCGVTVDGLRTAEGIVKLNVSKNPRVFT